jgi:hypothetical protein
MVQNKKIFFIMLIIYFVQGLRIKSPLSLSGQYYFQPALFGPSFFCLNCNNYKLEISEPYDLCNKSNIIYNDKILLSFRGVLIISK